MNEEFENYMETYRQKLDGINEKRDELDLFKRRVKFLRNDIGKDIEELYDYGNDKFIDIRLGDILKGIADIKDIPLENLKVSGMFASNDMSEPFRTWFSYNFNEEDFLKLSGILNVFITEKFDNFDTKFSFKCSLNDVQDDGSILLDHMQLKKYSRSDGNGYCDEDKNYSMLLLSEKDVKSIICHFDLNKIMKYQNNGSVFAKAVLEAMDLQRSKQKKLVR